MKPGDTCRYVAPTKDSEDSALKKFRAELRAQTLTIVWTNGAIANVKASNGRYYQQLPVHYLQAIS